MRLCPRSRATAVAASTVLVLALGAAVVLDPDAPGAGRPEGVLALGASSSAELPGSPAAVPADEAPVDAAAVRAPAAPRTGAAAAAVSRAPALRRAGGGPHGTPRPAARSVEQTGAEALASLAYPWQRLGYRVVFRPYRGAVLGLADSERKTITVYVKQGQSRQVLRTTIAHELGHALDFEHGTAERRAEYRRERGLPGGRWFPCQGCEDYDSAAGDFAEVFALWLAGPGDFRSRMAGPPTAGQLARLAPLFRVPDRPRAQAATSTQADGAQQQEQAGPDAGARPSSSPRPALVPPLLP